MKHSIMANSLLALFLSLVISTVLAAPSDAFQSIDKKAFKKQVGYVALFPVEARSALQIPDEVKNLIEQQLALRLDKLGYKVLPPQAVQDIREQMSQLVGDSISAEKKSEVVVEHSARELLYRHPVDAMIAVRVVATGAPFVKNKAQWWGVSQKIKHKGDGLFKALTGSGYQGTIGASAIKLSIWDRQDNLLYNWAGGIELLMWRNGKKLEKLPAAELWQDEKRIKKAVKLALDPL